MVLAVVVGVVVVFVVVVVGTVVVLVVVVKVEVVVGGGVVDAACAWAIEQFRLQRSFGQQVKQNPARFSAALGARL